MGAPRQRLAAAIEQRAAATAYLARVEAALAAAPLPYDDALTAAVAEATNHLEQARAAVPQRAIAAALGEVAIGPDPVAAAKQQLAEAEAAVTDAHERRRVLGEEAIKARELLDRATRDLHIAVRVVLSTSPELTALRQAWRETCVHAETLHEVLWVVQRAGYVPLENYWDSPPYGGWAPGAQRGELAQTWVGAIKRLEDDPNAPLPALP